MKDTLEHNVVMAVAEGLDALWISRYITPATTYPSGVGFVQSAMQNTGTSDFKVHNTCHNIPIKGRIRAVSDAEHRDQ